MTTPQAETLIDALNTTFGRHRGCRASHANGLQARGRFLPATPAAKVSVPYLQTEHPVTARFSIGGGKPGPIYQRVKALFAEYVAEYVKEHA